MMKFSLILLIALLSQALSFMPVKSVPQARFSLFLQAKVCILWFITLKLNIISTCKTFSNVQANNGINVNSEMIRKVMLQNLLLSGSVISTALLLNAGIVHAQTNVFDDNLEHSIEKREKIGQSF